MANEVSISLPLCCSVYRSTIEVNFIVEHHETKCIIINMFPNFLYSWPQSDPYKRVTLMIHIVSGKFPFKPIDYDRHQPFDGSYGTKQNNSNKLIAIRLSHHITQQCNTFFSFLLCHSCWEVSWRACCPPPTAIFTWSTATALTSPRSLTPSLYHLRLFALFWVFFSMLFIFRAVVYYFTSKATNQSLPVRVSDRVEELSVISFYCCEQTILWFFFSFSQSQINEQSFQWIKIIFKRLERQKKAINFGF